MFYWQKNYWCYYSTLTEETENKVIKFLNLKLAIESKYFLQKYFKQLLLSKLWMNYYSEPDSYIKNKTKGVLDLSNYDTEKKIEMDTSNWAAKKISMPWKLNLIKKTLLNWLLIQLV